MSLRVDVDHEMAVVFLIIDQDIDQLDRAKSRYAEAMVKLLKQINSGTISASNIKSIRPGVQVNYERTLRDEANSSFLSSVWVTFTAESNETL
jgi:hypothetical protein